MTEVMMTLINEITDDVVRKTAGTRKVTRIRFAEVLHGIISEVVHWLMHQIISYGFFGLQGETDKEQREYLSKMVVPVILE